MRSVLITGTTYMAGNFERAVAPDELLQMFGRAGGEAWMKRAMR
jgi:hypothetical protein